MKVSITRKTHFTAGHRLYNPDFSDEENMRIFGPCSNPHGHGHNYVLEVTVAGELDPKTGMIMNLKDLKKIINDHIISKCDHRNFSVDVDFTRDIIPTAENLAKRIFEVLDSNLPSGTLQRIKLFETENNIAIAERGDG
ncbi:MAG: 6-carboxytetrahydropterin synthase [candidate division Zixibacteria bacterium]|nr:6-carboxytetrahydropterin synthase [candidate division Zixibacteria bacterium]